MHLGHINNNLNQIAQNMNAPLSTSSITGAESPMSDRTHVSGSFSIVVWNNQPKKVEQLMDEVWRTQKAMLAKQPYMKLDLD